MAIKFEIKKFQTMRTDDGGGYSFDLYMDGKLVAFVCDEGNGGGVFARWHDQMHGVSESAKKLAEHIATLPPHPISDPNDWEKEHWPNGMEMDEDLFFSDLVTEFEMNRKLKRMMKTHVLFRLPEDHKDAYRTYKVPFTPEFAAKLKAKYPNAIILNEVGL